MKGNELMDAIRDEMARGGLAKHENAYVTALGEAMTVFIQRNPETEIAEGKTLKGAYQAAMKEARGNGNGLATPQMVFDSTMKYYGITPKKGELVACLLAMLGQTAPDKPQPAPATKAAPEDDLFDLDALLEGGA